MSGRTRRAPRNISSASAKRNPCFRKLPRFLASSHPKFIVTPNVATIQRIQIMTSSLDTNLETHQSVTDVTSAKRILRISQRLSVRGRNLKSQPLILAARWLLAGQGADACYTKGL